MFKKLLLVFVSAVLLLSAFGCACMNTTTPTPSVSPTATLMPTSEPSPTTPAVLSASPDLSASPGIGDEIMEGIENFVEGTEVKEDEVPEVVSAIEKDYSGAKIVSIKHAMQQNQQVYAVEIEQDGKTKAIYVKPDGTVLNDAGNTAGNTAGGTAGGTNP